MTISTVVRALVRELTLAVCEYCRLPESASVLAHQVDHIIGRQHRGTDDATNLCLCCIRCNLKKGPNIASVDVQSGAITALYHPRRETWGDHFRLADASIVGLTPQGRTTVELLDMNSEDRVQLRRILFRRGWRP